MYRLFGLLRGLLVPVLLDASWEVVADAMAGIGSKSHEEVLAETLLSLPYGFSLPCLVISAMCCHCRSTFSILCPPGTGGKDMQL